MPTPHPGGLPRQACIAALPILCTALATVLLVAGGAGAQSGVLDPTFGTGGVASTALGPGDDFAYGLAIDDEDRILLAGTCLQANDDFCLVRHELDGTPDTSLNGTGKLALPVRAEIDRAFAVALQGDRKIVLAGFSREAGKDEFALARVDESGALDPTFDGDGKVTTPIGTLEDQARAVAIQADGKIVAAGYTLTSANRDLAVVRYTATGALDPTFDGDGKVTLGLVGADEAAAIAIQTDGKIVLAGYAIGQQEDFLVVRLLADGALDPAFNGGAPLLIKFGTGQERANGIALQPDGKILVVGRTRIGSVFHFAVARLLADGTLDATLDGDGKVTTIIGTGSEASSVAVDATGRFVVAGFAKVPSNEDFALVRYDDDGSLDTNFAGGVVTLPIGGAVDVASAVAVQRDGKIVLAGSKRSANDDDFAAVRYLVDDCGNGTIDVGEECDGGALIDGDCCDTGCDLLPAATLCRAVEDGCDIDDFCDGASGACLDVRKPDGDDDGVCDEADLCPLDPDPEQEDGDDDGLGDVCDPCTNGVLIGKPKIRMTKYTTGPGDDTFSFTGQLDLPVPPAQLDPVANGVRVILADAAGAVLFDVAVPPGAYSPVTRSGWIANKPGTAFTFRTTTAAGGLIDKLKLSFTATRPDLLKLTMSGRRGGFATAPPELPLSAVMVVDAPTAATGECGEIQFAPDGCSFNRNGSTLSCK
ncbi:MAG: hypothetical protein AB1689_06765 [Thermodesulfobacteriota bacterium]